MPDIKSSWKLSKHRGWSTCPALCSAIQWLKLASKSDSYRDLDQSGDSWRKPGVILIHLTYGGWRVRISLLVVEHPGDSEIFHDLEPNSYKVLRRTVIKTNSCISPTMISWEVLSNAWLTKTHSMPSLWFSSLVSYLLLLLLLFYYEINEINWCSFNLSKYWLPCSLLSNNK